MRAGHGGGVYMFHMLKHLASRHSVTLATFADEREENLIPSLREYGITVHIIPRMKGFPASIGPLIRVIARRAWGLLLSIFGWKPYYVTKYRQRSMADLIARLTRDESFDIVQIEYAQMADYIGSVARGKTVLHDHDVALRHVKREIESAKNSFSRIVLIAELKKWVQYYRQLPRRFDHVLTITEQDKNLLQEHSQMRNISYLPAGVSMPELVHVFEAREPCTIVFMGSFAHRPNVDAAMWLVDSIFPKIKRSIPEAILKFIGPNPPPTLREKESSVVKILGFVEDLSRHLRTSTLFLAPLRIGGGLKIKILDAMTHGIPVVTTTVGIEGIDGFRNGDALVGETSDELARIVISMLTDKKLAAETGKRGYELVKKYYSWDRATSELERVYKSLYGHK